MGASKPDLAERLLQVSKSDWAEIHHQPRALAESGLWLLAGGIWSVVTDQSIDRNRER